jgi:16S rRNA processing protein RimM
VSEDRKILVGTFSGAHGVKGLVRLKSFTEDPEAILRYKPLTDATGEREFAIKLKMITNTHLIVGIKGVKTRDAAEALRGTKLFVERSVLPKLKKREFYEADLVGLNALDKKGKTIGTVEAVHNYGGGPFLEIVPAEGKAFMLPFTKECVPEVDVEEGRIVIAPPEGWVDTESSSRRKPGSSTSGSEQKESLARGRAPLDADVRRHDENEEGKK